MTDLPSGTVTFLFTDIEGSTKLAQANASAWEAARRRHHALLQTAFESNDGHIFNIVGDAFCVAFHNPSHAIAASVAAQCLLQAEAWGETPVRVRMGLHTGTAEARDGDYQGYLTLAHVQRVMSAAYGGQTLISNATGALLSEQMPPGIALRDLGEHRLKGLLNPEHLWQVVAAELAQEFPPLQSLNAIPNNLPIQVTSFVGRERELMELQRLLPTSRLLTLTGSGGTGKTRLSLQVAAEVLDTFKDGVWFVELAPLSDPALVPIAVASALGVREEPGRPMESTLKDYLQDKHLLLMLDNCEHLIDACARFADAVLHASPGIRILATSREALGIAGESAWRVPSMPTPNPTDSISLEKLEQYSAIQLFIERAKQSLATFAVTRANAPAVAQICYRLDGIPLAIELAAARVKAMRVEQIVERLDDRFRLLTGGSRTALPRQQTLRSLVDWSHSLLSEPERLLLRRLSVFAGGWTLEAVEAVCADDVGAHGRAPLPQSEILDLLTHLVDKSLVVLDEQAAEPRYRLLETIRQYAREKLLDAGEGERLRDKHLAFFLKLAERAEAPLFTSQRVEWISRLEADIDNLRAALEWAYERDLEAARLTAGRLRQFWLMNHLNEAHSWYERVLGLTGARTARTNGMALALLGAGINSQILLALDDAQAFLDQSVALLRMLDDKARLAEALYGLCLVKIHQGDSEGACVIFETNESIFRQSAVPIILASALSWFAVAFTTARADFATAGVLLEQSLVVGRKAKDPLILGATYEQLGKVATQQGDYVMARQYLLQGLSYMRQSGGRPVGIILGMVADVAYLQGDFAGARTSYTEALASVRAVGNQSHVAHISTGLGYLAVQQGELEQAAAVFAECVDILSKGQYQLGVARCLAGYAELRRAQGYAEQAVRLLASEVVYSHSRSTNIPIDRIRHERTLAAARAQLDEATFNSAWDAGRRLSLEQAIELALEKPRD